MGEARRRRQAERLVSGSGTVNFASPPEPYAHMSIPQYWEMLEGEDPDDRAIREAHGIGYEEDYQDPAVTCRYGCGATYREISSGKMRTCPARQSAPEERHGDPLPAVGDQHRLPPLP